MNQELSPFERGDHQTPLSLARQVIERLAKTLSPRTILEPTCGRGHFLRAASETFSSAKLIGYELNEAHVATARADVPRSVIQRGDVFAVDWDEVLAKQPGPVLIVGNPPWVTSAALSLSENTPRERGGHGLVGLEAVTGASNFDLAEAITLRLLRAASSRSDEVTLAFLIKSSVARRLMVAFARESFARPVALFAIDARVSFGVSVDACLFVAKSGSAKGEVRCDVFESLDGDRVDTLRVVDGQVRSGEIEKPSFDLPPLTWRSGIKHDRVKVMELRRDGERLINGLGETVDIELSHRFPLLKATDLARGNASTRELVVPQRRVGQATDDLPTNVAAYLRRHAAGLNARRSRVYVKQPPYAIFGVGDYTFANHKVAVSGLHPEPHFRVIGPSEGRPMVFDDTCYFACFDSEKDAKEVAKTLNSASVKRFLGAHIFAGQKRPVTKRLLSRL